MSLDLKPCPFCGGTEYFIKDYNCQVIGNIYDNPELLKGSIENE